MFVIRMRSSSEAKDMLKRIRKMAKYAEELEDTLEECIEDIDDKDDEYREDDEELHSSPRRSGGRRYRRM